MILISSAPTSGAPSPMAHRPSPARSAPLAPVPSPTSSARSAPTWPRIYAQHIERGDIFELARGIEATSASDFAYCFGPAWHIFQSNRHRTAADNAHRTHRAGDGLHITPAVEGAAVS